ncbi:MAG TPA: glycoside hydrolase family 92 protein, partial [Bacteroidales bacterium]|nr:glycoside hydrolase family 92 protein [Bacteroidales bacterium]
DNNQNNCYVKKAMLNNKPYSKNFILHDDILKGGTLTFSMDQLPNTTKGTLKDDAPYSMSGLVR